MFIASFGALFSSGNGTYACGVLNIIVILFYAIITEYFTIIVLILGGSQKP